MKKGWEHVKSNEAKEQLHLKRKVVQRKKVDEKQVVG